MIQTNIIYEITDTYGGEANYGWVRRGALVNKPGEDFSDLAAVRRVKKDIGWSGRRCVSTVIGETIELRPVGVCQVCFITFHSFGNASS